MTKRSTGIAVTPEVMPARAAFLAAHVALDAAVHSPDGKLGGPDQAKAVFDAALRLFVAAYVSAREAGAVFGPTTTALLQNANFQAQFLDIGASRRARAAANSEA